MSGRARERETLAVYEARVADYAALNIDRKERPDLDAFAARLPEGGSVLDLGCGPGTSAALLAARGFTVEAVDGAANMVAAAARHPGVQARQARFDEIEGRAIYDGVWANFSLLHAPREEFPGHLARLHRALRPGGWLHLGMKLGEGEGPDRLGRHYTYYGAQDLERLMTEAGFAVAYRRSGEDSGLDGTVSRFLCLQGEAIPLAEPPG